MFKNHGNSHIILLHGGPGAIGSVHKLAKALACVEVLNYGQTIEEQLAEIDEAVTDIEQTIVIGHSYGAWLGYIYASKRPIKKLILISCGAFDEKYLDQMMDDRFKRLTEKEKLHLQGYFKDLETGVKVEKLNDLIFLLTKMDSYQLVDSEALDQFDFTGHQKLMGVINKLRKSGDLLKLGIQIKCPVLVMHGQEDSHPLRGITEAFKRIKLSYRLYSYELCGHYPWLELYAKDQFLKDLLKECRYKFTSKRLGFRQFYPSDSDSFYDMNSSGQVMKYFPKIMTRQESDDFLSRIMTAYESGYGLYAVEKLDDHSLIGFVGLSNPTFQADFTPCTEIGWRLKDIYWHKGYGKEGASAVLKYAKDYLKLKEIVSFTAEINKPSIALMKSIGMTYDCTFNHPRVSGALRSHVLYRIEL